MTADQAGVDPCRPVVEIRGSQHEAAEVVAREYSSASAVD
jgi:hypothetical protein